MSNPNVPIVNAGLLYVNGLQLAYATATTMTVAAGAARDSSNVDDIVLGASATINGGLVGANGVDIAVLAASSFYAVYVIGDSKSYQATAGLLSLSATAPSLPAGYDMFRRIGYILTDSSKNILKFWQFGTGQSRKMWYDVVISVLSGGSSTTYANVDCSAAVPIASEITFNIAYTANSATNTAQFLPYGSSATNGIVQYGCGVAAAQVGSIVIPSELNSAKSEIQYKVVTSDALTLSVAGYVDYLN